MLDIYSAISLFLACLTCVLCAWAGFNSPSWVRTYTSFARFSGALVSHITLYIVMLLVVFASLDRFRFEILADERIPLSTTELVWISLGITLLVRAFWTRPRLMLHRVAGVPSHARKLAAFLADCDFKPSEEIGAQAQAILMSRGIDVTSKWIPTSEQVYKLLLKATALYLELREWEQKPQFARFMREARNDLDSLRKRFDRLSFRVSRAFASFDRLAQLRQAYGKPDNGDDAQVDGLIRTMIGDQLADSCEDITAFIDDACLLTARGALTNKRTRKRRTALFENLGFVSRRAVTHSGYASLLSAGLILLAGLWVFFLILPTQANINTKALVAVVSLITFISLTSAIVPKVRWGFANAGLRRGTPFGFVVGAGAFSVACAIIVNLVAGAILVGGASGAKARLEEGLPWLTAPFLIATTMAWLVQDHRWLAIAAAWRRRRRDSITFGVAWFVAGVSGQLLHSAMAGSGPTMWDSGFLLQRVFEPSLAGLALGAVIGYIVPESVRNRARVTLPTQKSREAQLTSIQPLIERRRTFIQG